MFTFLSDAFNHEMEMRVLALEIARGKFSGRHDGSISFNLPRPISEEDEDPTWWKVAKTGWSILKNSLYAIGSGLSIWKSLKGEPGGAKS